MKEIHSMPVKYLDMPCHLLKRPKCRFLLDIIVHINLSQLQQAGCKCEC